MNKFLIGYIERKKRKKEKEKGTKIIDIKKERKKEEKSVREFEQWRIKNSG